MGCPGGEPWSFGARSRIAMALGGDRSAAGPLQPATTARDLSERRNGLCYWDFCS
jgi:hypothetical protein